MLELGFERLNSERGCFVKKGVSHKDTIIVVVHVNDLLSVGSENISTTSLCNLEKTLACRVH